MYQFIDIDKASELVKHILETNRCAVCDKSIGKRMRYPCGHTSCGDCVPPTESCPFCLTPQDSSTFAAPSFDKPSTVRSQNANALLTAFQTDFNVDVNKRQRLAEQQKVEKELFPECIQAPAKYYNKRKSSKPYTENKENTFFPGEQVSFSSEMERSSANVREWLNKCPKRKPLGDINHTISNINGGLMQNQPLKDLNNQDALIDRLHRKRHHAGIWSGENKSVIDKVLKKPMKRSKKKSTSKSSNENAHTKPRIKKFNKNDSGIAVDDNSLIVVDDSQSITVDKDMQAWLAVLEVEKNRQCLSSTVDSKLNQNENWKQHFKVPFYKKSSLFDICKDCNDFYKTAHQNTEKPQKVSITIESSSFIAVVNVSKVQDKISTKQSVEVQTDFIKNGIKAQDFEVDEGNLCEKDEINEAVSPIPGSSNSVDIFLGEANVKLNPMNKTVNESTNVIIEESDSDEDIDMSTSMTVIADVHRACDDILILGNVEDLEEHSKRARRAARGLTPASSDSSDKENYNPNRMKKTNCSKKKPVKK